MAPPKPQPSPPSTPKDESSPKKKRGWNEIESLFESKKEQKKSAVVAVNKAKEEKKKRRKAKLKQEETADEFARRCRDDKEKSTWVDDGLGGKFNGEGFTGRVEDGVRVFKRHVLDKPQAGFTDQCPFDCDCCYI